ncbi:MAG TPA: MmgE/PrpD family protein [Xanthobacteraceae bacterium]|nr:MmgE/PrpD family protein [Xanthobacteraceae bacterium]
MIQPLEEISAPTRALAAYIAQAPALPLPAAVAEKARHHVLDTLAAMLSGSRLAPGRIAIAYVRRLGGRREASVAGSRVVTSCVNAALANGMLAHADETDDSHAPSRNHPGCAVVPAALAAAEAMHASGEQFLRAVVLGYDVAARINYALGADAFAFAGRMTHSFGGTFGAGAAAAALLGLDALQARHLLSYCAQQASGVGASVRDADHIEKAFDFGGMPARNGVAAATMVAAGFTGVDDVFSGERNFFQAYAAEPDPARLADGLGQRFEILGTNIKKWSAGSPAQSAIDALLQLMETKGLTAGKVKAITVRLPTGSDRTVDRTPAPDVNIQHLLALLLIDGTLTFRSIHDRGRMDDPAILALRARIEVVPSDELLRARPRRQAIVEVDTNDGERHSHRVVAVRGTADNPMDRAEVEAKARDLMGGVLGRKRSETLIGAIRDLAAAKNMARLRLLWQAATPRPTTEAEH